MGKFSSKEQVVYAAAVWVFGGDGELTGEEKTAIEEGMNRSRTPWTFDVRGEDAHWVHSLYRGGDLSLSDIVEAIDYDFDFSLHEKYLLYSCVCVPMHDLEYSRSFDDGWSRAGDLRNELNIDSDDYNRWAERD